MFEWLRQEYQIKSEYNYEQILKIYKTIDRLTQKYDTHIGIQWCNRGVWRGNKRADQLAKQAVDSYIKDNSTYQRVPEQTSKKRIKTIVKEKWNELNSINYQSESNAHYY